MAAPLRTGRLFETPFTSGVLPTLLGFFGLSGACYAANSAAFGQPWPSTFSPEFLAEAKKIGNVTVGGTALPGRVDCAARPRGWRWRAPARAEPRRG